MLPELTKLEELKNEKNKEASKNGDVAGKGNQHRVGPIARHSLRSVAHCSVYPCPGGAAMSTGFWVHHRRKDRNFHFTLVGRSLSVAKSVWEHRGWVALGLLLVSVVYWLDRFH
ncbi:MAG: hypothetical protein PHF79_03060 [Candidatus Pacebacteria bacterium]|nr:hypothetical protein [Candidatus Paceibacterota bacterium]